MWYDEIGLFRPAAVNPENGYRCYNYHQSPLLETILLLRELEVPIQAIQDYIKNRSAENLKDLLDEKIADLDLKITHLQAVRETLCTHRQNMAALLTMDLSEISVIEKRERCLITVDITKDTAFEEEVELITAETEKYHLGRLHHAAKLFIEIPLLTYQKGLHMSPGGRYLRAFHKGNLDRMPKRYEEIFAFAEKHNLTLCGFSYEMGINENVIDRIEDYIVQIEIPVL